MQETISPTDTYSELMPHEAQELDAVNVSELAVDGTELPDHFKVATNPNGSSSPVDISLDGGAEYAGVPVLSLTIGDQSPQEVLILDVRKLPVFGKDRQGQLERQDSEAAEIGLPPVDYVAIIKGEDGSWSINRLAKGWKMGVRSNLNGFNTLGAVNDATGEEKSVLNAENQGVDIGIEEDEHGNLIFHNYSQSKAVLKPTGETESGKEQLSPEDAMRLFSYEDVLPNEAALEQSRKFLEESASARKYAESLSEVSGEHGIKHIVEVADSVRIRCLGRLEQAGLDPSLYAHSVSWAMWDIAKQYYFSKHPEESGAAYKAELANPLENTEKGRKKLEEITYRHIGWEAEQAYYQGTLKAVSSEAQAILAQAKKDEKGGLRLSSYDLVRLGKVIASR